MKALFADLSEQDRQRKQDIHAHKATERRQVLVLCDAIQVAVARGQHDRANTLLQEMHAIVDSDGLLEGDDVSGRLRRPSHENEDAGIDSSLRRSLE
jgi:hypothetical protein